MLTSDISCYGTFPPSVDRLDIISVVTAFFFSLYRSNHLEKHSAIQLSLATANSPWTKGRAEQYIHAWFACLTKNSWRPGSWGKNHTKKYCIIVAVGKKHSCYTWCDWMYMYTDDEFTTQYEIVKNREPFPMQFGRCCWTFKYNS